MSETLIFRANLADRGERLDSFLQQRMEESRSRVQRWIKEGQVQINGGPCKPSQRLQPDDKVEVRPLPSPQMDLVAEDLPLCVVFEDDSLLVVDKPAGMVVHPGAGHTTGTLVNALLHHFEPMSRGETIRPGIVHRLDKDTSGLLVVAKTDRVHDELARQFKERSVTKLYLTLVHGRVEKDRGEIDLPIGRHPTRRTRMSTRGRTSRSALTEYRVIRRFSDCSYLEVKLHTGRTHQIRVHLEKLGHPVAGDPVYRANRPAPPAVADGAWVRRLKRQFLHAAVLGFRHPVTGAEHRFESAVPADLAAILELLE